MSVLDRIKTGWNAFRQNESNYHQFDNSGPSYSTRPDGIRLTYSSEKSILTSIYNQIAIDVASIDISHIRTDDQNRYLRPMKSLLQECLSIEANLDQASTAFKINAAISLCDKGVIAIVPTDTTGDPNYTESYDIRKLRIGEIIEWKSDRVRVRVYNELKGIKEEVVLKKSFVGIVENPLAPIMNSPNSTLQRLIRKLNLLDLIDEQAGSGKLDLLIQLPYTIKTDTRKKQAKERRQDIEEQLKGSKYGVAYIDSTERITQLNRPAENNLLSQIEYLTKMVYSQLGINEEVFDGTANEQIMLNYFNRTVEPMVRAITEEMNRKFLSKTARSQHQKIVYSRNPFTLVPVENLAEIADKFTRNEILSSNEFRGIIGYRPVDDPKADALINSNLNQSKEDRSYLSNFTENGEEVDRQNESKT